MSKKRKKQIRRGTIRALITLSIMALGLFVLNCGWDYIRSKHFLSFADDRWLLGANVAIVVLAPVAAFMSAFKRKSDKNVPHK